jgi:hypothetical protein
LTRERERAGRLDVGQGRGSVEVARDERGWSGQGVDDGAWHGRSSGERWRGPKSRARAWRQRLGREEQGLDIGFIGRQRERESRKREVAGHGH